jgi:hypothetical protein
MTMLRFQYTATADLFGDMRDLIAFCQSKIFPFNFDSVDFGSMREEYGGKAWIISFTGYDEFDTKDCALMQFYLTEDNEIIFHTPLDRPARESAYLIKRLGVNEDLIAQFTSPAAQAFARAMFDKSKEMLALTHQPHRER